MNLVTGATGHIGNVLVRQLLARGEPVRVLVRTDDLPPALDGLDVDAVVGDILDPQAVRRAVQGVRVVYHLAARISLTDSPDHETERVNLDGTRNILAALRSQAEACRLVYTSSVYALRVPQAGPIDESLPFDSEHTRGAYDRSKAAASLEVQAAAVDGLEAVIACPSAVAGPYDFRVSEAGRGILYNLSPGIKFYVDGAYDFVDVRDVAAGLILAAERGRSGENYILGSERLTVREVAEIVWKAAGGWHTGIWLPDWVADLAAEVLPWLSDDPIVTRYSLEAVRSNSYISHAKAGRQLGYRPRPARLAILDAVRWWQQQMPTLPAPETIAKASV
jgi:dihydroflavonol-4-reductase